MMFSFISIDSREFIRPLPKPPTLCDAADFHIKSQAFLDALPNFYSDVYSTEKQWVCAYCRTKTNLFTYRKNGSKSCYNCGSNEGEIK